MEPSESAPARARRGRPRSLTEDQIVAAALELARPIGLERVSMRALADALGVPVMTIYNYVPNKDALHELVTDVVLRSVRVPPPDEGTWEQRLKQLEQDARAALARHPGVSLDRRRDSAEGRRLAEGVLSILDDAGFAPADAALAFATLFTFMIGQIDVDLDVVGTGGPAAEAVQSAARAATLTRDEIFEFGFDAVLQGLKLKLGHHSRG